MDTLIELIATEEFKWFAPIVIGAVVSWYISKHFFFKKEPSKIQLARKQKTTDFGNHRIAQLESPDEVINHSLFGKLTIKGNGTWTDEKNRLMWIQAPWGMDWNGQHFAGNPIKLDWYTATELFGRGGYMKGLGANLIVDNSSEAAKVKYTKGSCRVKFASSESWRLPTAMEMNTIGFYKKDDTLYDSSSSEESKKLREHLFPSLATLTEKYFLWTANEAGSNTAWAVDGVWPPGDFKYSQEFFILFVRSY